MSNFIWPVYLLVKEKVVFSRTIKPLKKALSEPIFFHSSMFVEWRPVFLLKSHNIRRELWLPAYCFALQSYDVSIHINIHQFNKTNTWINNCCEDRIYCCFQSDEEQKNITCRIQSHKGQYKVFVKLHRATSELSELHWALPSVLQLWMEKSGKRRDSKEDHIARDTCNMIFYDMILLQYLAHAIVFCMQMDF